MLRVIQITEEKGLTVWCTSDCQDVVLGVCQYLMDGADPAGLNDFYIMETDHSVQPEKVSGRTGFYAYCEMHGIRKRTFEERMQGNEITRNCMSAWAETIRRNEHE